MANFERGPQIARRHLLGGAALLGAGALLPRTVFAAADNGYIEETVPLQSSETRSTVMHIWRPQHPTGTLLFSTGHGSWPERYHAMIKALVADGYAVFAPLHVDSVHYPDRGQFTLEQGFTERLADMRAARKQASALLGALPSAAMGHSFGSLIAMCLGGALANIGPFRDPDVSAVLAFSSPGKIPGLIAPVAYQSLNVPTMMITGAKDVVPGFVTDPTDHLFPITSSPAENKYSLVLNSAEHDLVGQSTSPLFDKAKAAARLFINAYVPFDPAAKTALEQFSVGDDDNLIVRGS